MRWKKWSILAAALIVASCAHAQNEQTLYAFPGGSNGANPGSGNLVSDHAGNLYGTTSEGGLFGFGTVFELAPSNGTWVETVIHNFTGGSDGATPDAGLTRSETGALYGTTVYGGYGYGTVYEMTLSGSTWILHVLYTFDGIDGYYPIAAPVLDSENNLYGTTESAGPQDCGNVYELKHDGTGWSQSVLYTFEGNPICGPESPVVLDAEGNLYATSSSGGAQNYGNVFELKRLPGGQYAEITLHTFAGGSDGRNPGSGGLVFDKDGNLYGTTLYGGGAGCNGSGCGTVFELKRSNGFVAETIVYSFMGETDGEYPNAGLTSDGAGIFYGTTISGGVDNCSGYGCGTVFRLEPSDTGWKESVLYSFTGGADGESSGSGVITDSSGNLFGTTNGGGNENGPCSPYGCGVVYEITP
jgi:uncharacterized repeat protein (TIGR03803 family)